MSATDMEADTRKRAWLEAFAELGMVVAACSQVDVPRSTVYQWRQRDEAFALAWHDLEEATTERMEREAYRRAVEGVVDKIHVDRDGNIVGEEIRYSDTLLIFMLKARKPDTYRDNVHVKQDIKISAAGGVLVENAALAEEGRGLLRRAASIGGDVAGGPSGSDQ